MITFQDKCHRLYEGLPFMEIRGEYIPFPCLAEVKLDGEFQYIIKEGGKVTLLNKKEHGRIRKDMSATCNLDIPDNTILLGELVWGDGKSFYDFARHKLDHNNNLGIFDCLRWDGEDVWKTHNHLDIRGLLEKQSFYNEKVCLVPKAVCRDKQELDTFYHRVISQGYEGIVIIDPYSKYIDGATGRRAKRKNVADVDLVIMGFQTNNKRVKTLSILVGHKVNGKIQEITHVGGGFGATTVPKETLLSVLKDMVIDVKGDDYYVEPKLVATIKHYGIIRNVDGSVSSLRHPQFCGIRFDKTVEGIDTII